MGEVIRAIGATTPPRRAARLPAALAVAVAVVLGLALPQLSSTSPASAAVEPATAGASLSIGVGDELPVASGDELVDVGPALVHGPVVLAAPASEPTVHGISVPLKCFFLPILSDDQCVDDIIQFGYDLATSAVSEAAKNLMAAMNTPVRQTAKWMSEFILVQQLGAEDGMADARPEVDAGWFLGQYSVMRAISLFFVVPMLMIVIIHSILRGSLFFLLRAVLIMLPTAVIGSAALVFLTDLLLDVADKFSAAIARNVMEVDKYGNSLNAAIDNMAHDTGLFSTTWLIFMIIASVIIYLELILRETGIYLAAFFLPMAFSALVWPSTAKWAKRLIELLVGLIFSKVFITGAVALGMAAVANSGATVDGLGANPTTSEIARATEMSIGAVAAGAAILIMACFAGAKVLAFTPSAMASAEGRVADTAKLWSKGQVASAGLEGLRKSGERKRDSISPKGDFKNVGASGGGGGSGNGNGSTPTPTVGGGGGGGGGNKTPSSSGGGSGNANPSGNGSGGNNGRPSGANGPVPVPVNGSSGPTPTATSSGGTPRAGGGGGAGGTATARASSSGTPLATVPQKKAAMQKSDFDLRA